LLFVQDPNSTSAWNGLISGRKKWILYPPHSTPPGVHAQDSDREVVTPVSVAEWFVNHYNEHSALMNDHPKVNASNRSMKPLLSNNNDDDDAALDEQPCVTDYTDYSPIECICEAGEMIYIPHHWFHTALNLTESVALTGNHVTQQNLLATLDFLKVDGNSVLLDAFQKAVELKHPGLIERLRSHRAASEPSKEHWQSKSISSNHSRQPKSSIWSQIIRDNNDNTSTSLFDFSDF
jgi:hypothetical protein